MPRSTKTGAKERRRQARERQRRKRERDHALRMVVNVEVGEDLEQRLVELKKLPENREINKRDIADAICILLRESLGLVTRDNVDS